MVVLLSASPCRTIRPPGDPSSSLGGDRWVVKAKSAPGYFSGYFSSYFSAMKMRSRGRFARYCSSGLASSKLRLTCGSRIRDT